MQLGEHVLDNRERGRVGALGRVAAAQQGRVAGFDAQRHHVHGDIGTDVKNGLLAAIADALDARADEIAAANALDMSQAFDEGMDAGKLDRLKFDVPRIAASAQDMRHVATLPDPVGQVVRGFEAPNGLRLQQVRVPMGVIGMIYEARPNVTVDVVSLCIKSGNAVVVISARIVDEPYSRIWRRGTWNACRARPTARTCGPALPTDAARLGCASNPAHF